MSRGMDMAYWICNREEMRTRKEGNLTPTWCFGWHDDFNMGTVRYCNVRREDDRVTRWIATHWRNPNVNEPTFIQAMVLARLVNWPAALEEIGFPRVRFYGKLFVDTMFCREKRGEKCWTGAYTISTCGKRMGKAEYVASVVKAVGEKTFEDFTLLDHLHRDLMSIPGLGSFLAAQVVADVKNTPGHPLQSAQDWHTWAAPGPGSLRGLTVFHGRNTTAHHFRDSIQQAWEVTKPLLPVHLQDLHMQDFQNCLCEFSKYIRIKEGDGRARNRYRPWAA